MMGNMTELASEANSPVEAWGRIDSLLVGMDFMEGSRKCTYYGHFPLYYSFTARQISTLPLLIVQ